MDVVEAKSKNELGTLLRQYDDTVVYLCGTPL